MQVDENTMLRVLGKACRVFLLEPNYPRKYPPLGLAKISTYLKTKGVDVVFGRAYNGEDCDLVCITSLFTFQSAKVLQAIDQVLFRIPEKQILLVGVLASLLPRFVDKARPSVMVFRGYSKELDKCPPDYAVDSRLEEPWTKFSFVFTGRGCPNKCAYCAVWRIEPEMWINPNWRMAIDPDKPYVMISDNNLSACDQSHIEDVVIYCAEHKKKVVFDNGFDCKHITPEMAKLLAKVKYTRRGMRLAFDRIEEDGVFQAAVEHLKANGVPKSQIMVYVLFNFRDTPEEAHYRMRECVRLGVRPYPQLYEPLNKLDRKTRHVGKHWNLGLLRQFRHYWMMAGIYSKMTFEEYCDKESARTNSPPPKPTAPGLWAGNR